MSNLRLRSLDVLRGLTVAAMIIVNNPGDWGQVYWPLLHAEWHGWTPTDLVFPYFLFIVGASVPFGRAQTWTAIVRRSAIIFGLGLFLSGFPFFRLETLRIPGVLQRIAICYLAAASLVKATAGHDRSTSNRLVVGAILACLIGYWLLLALVPAPDGVAGDLTAEGNLGAWIDRQLLGGHLWKAAWDPEGLLSTVPAIGTTLLGVLAGRRLQDRSSPRVIVSTLAVWGLAGVVAGLLWHTAFPINKNLWTSSYVLFTAGVAAASLGACYWWVDVSPGRRTLALTEPVVALGRNALLLFVVSGLVGRILIYLKWPDPAVPLGRWIYLTVFAPLGPPKVSSLLYALSHLIVLSALLWVLHRKKIYLTT